MDTEFKLLNKDANLIETAENCLRSWKVAQDPDSEKFIEFLLPSMFLLKKYDFFGDLLDRVNLKPAHFNDLKVSHRFLGNFWRIYALYQLTVCMDTNSVMAEFEQILSCLTEAAAHYKASNSEWGLGLTYNMCGRLYT